MTTRKHLCHLHVAKLNLPKTPWKWGLLNNCSDDARQQVQEKLAEFGHHLDLRRKDAGRDGSKKWFTGEAWGRLIAGDGKSPGGPVAIATFLVKFVFVAAPLVHVLCGTGVAFAVVVGGKILDRMDLRRPGSSEPRRTTATP